LPEVKKLTSDPDDQVKQAATRSVRLIETAQPQTPPR
jgi:hypothetical protein